MYNYAQNRPLGGQHTRSRSPGTSTDSEEEGEGWRLLNCEACNWPVERAQENPGVLICIAACLVLALAFALISLDTVEPLHWGIRYNHFSKSAETDVVYGPGRYLVGPFRKFLIFPSSTQTIEFAHQHRVKLDGRRFEPLHTRTKEGLGLHLQVSLQYRLRTASLGRLYEKFNQAYEDVFVSTLRDTLIKAASRYQASDLWTHRQEFGDDMQAMVNKSLWGLNAECWGLQLLDVNLPDNYDNSIVKTQVQNQLMKTRTMQQAMLTIRAETSVVKADYSRKEKVILANGHANYTLITKQAAAEAQQKRIDTESAVLQNAGYTLTMTGEDLVIYQKYGALDDLEASKVFYGFGGAAPMLISSGP